MIGGKNTAKRKINIRNYLKQQVNLRSSPSSPFLNGDSDEDISSSSNDTTIELYNSNTKKKYSSNIDFEKYLPKENLDEILSPNVNLDQADRFIASLKLPKKRIQNLKSLPKKTKILFSAEDFFQIKEKGDYIDQLMLLESQDHDEVDDSLI